MERTVSEQAGAESWDARLYDRSFGFVSAFGADMVDLLDPKPGEIIVDLGCGTGELAVAIAARGAQVIGIDADAAMVARARAQHRDMRFIQADGHDFRVDAPVDAVFSNAALHWMTEPTRVIGCVARALRPNARFVAEMGAYKNIKTITDALYQALAEQGVAAESVVFPWFFPRPSSYVAMLRESGLEIDYLHYFARPTPLDDCENGLADWMHMFARHFLDAAPPEAVEAVIARTEALTRESLCPDGRWVTDYTRLRFVARKVVD